MPRGFGGPGWHGGGGRRGGWFMQRGFLQPWLLLLLSKAPQHGYSLMEELGERNLLGTDLDVGNLYRTLRRMEAMQLVESAWSSAGSGPNKRVYQITSQGQELVRQWAGALEQRTRLITEFLDEFHRVYGQEGSLQPTAELEDGDNPI